MIPFYVRVRTYVRMSLLFYVRKNRPRFADVAVLQKYILRRRTCTRIGSTIQKTYTTKFLIFLCGGCTCSNGQVCWRTFSEISQLLYFCTSPFFRIDTIFFSTWSLLENGRVQKCNNYPWLVIICTGPLESRSVFETLAHLFFLFFLGNFLS